MSFADQFETKYRHLETDKCEGWHCHSHGVDEDHAGAYLCCGECFHVYRTARELRRAHRREVRDVFRADYVSSDPLRERLILLWYCLLALLKPASKIHFCQECAHDF